MFPMNIGRYTLSDHLTPLEGFQPLGQGTFGLREFKSLRGSIDICLVSQGSRSQCRQSIVLIPLNVMFFSAPPPHFWEVLFTPCFTRMAIHTDSSSPRPPSIPSTTAAICRAREQAHRSRDAVPTILLTAASLSACCEAFLIKMTGHLFIPGPCIFVPRVSWELGRTAWVTHGRKVKRFSFKNATKIFRPTFRR